MGKIREHFEKHKKLYIVGGIGLAVGTVGTVLYFKFGVKPTIVGNDICVNKISGININSTNVIQTNLIRRGHPGNIIKCLETGEVFASQNRAAEAMGISASRLSDHLRGVTDNVKGLHFEKLGEMQ